MASSMANSFSGKLHEYMGVFEELAQQYGFQDTRPPKDIRVMTEGISGGWVVEMRFADDCMRFCIIERGDSTEVGRVIRRWFIEHGYRPKYAQELHGGK